MKRNILLIEPNYQNKFPPIGLMKLATYFKSMGDNVVFFKGEIKDFIIERAVDKCILKLYQEAPHVNWKSKHDNIKGFIRTRKKTFFQSLELDETADYFSLVKDWLDYYKDYIWKKYYLLDNEKEWDWICVTTLFTFYFDITVETINQVKALIKPDGKIMVGGVLATLQPKELEQATGIKPYVGLLNKPGDIDPDNDIIIDTLPLDYSILEEVDYRYEMANAYYGSMTKGCKRHCPFCAVPVIEPTYQDFNSISDRIERVDELYGGQRNLLLMDNNVLASDKFQEIIDDIIKAGFGAGATFVPPNQLELAVNKLMSKDCINERAYLRKAQREYIQFLNAIKDKELSYKVYSVLYDKKLLTLGTATKENIILVYQGLKDDYARFHKNIRPQQRIVDFNQGVDARYLTEDKAKLLSKIAIYPLRIAFDNLSVEAAYLQAIRNCVKYGIKNFSNYLLYNFKDTPDELYYRLEINVRLCDELGINIYSFPMKYHPLFGECSHNRDYIGEHWTRKYIRSVQAILNSTKGSIGRGMNYFHEAFGSTKEQFHLLLDMPDTYIIYRYFFRWLEEKGHPLSSKKWEETYTNLTDSTREEFLSIIHAPTFTSAPAGKIYGGELGEIMKFYVNLRDAVQNKNGEFYVLKQEYDQVSSVHARRAKAMHEKKLHNR